MPTFRDTQKIGRLTALKDVLARIAAEVWPVTSRDVALSDAAGTVLAADLVATMDHPPAEIALRDGYGVRADDTADANSYAPVPLANARLVQVGDAMLSGADAVLPPEGIMDTGGTAAVIALAGGEGVAAAGTDVQAGQPLLGAGHKMRAIDVTALQALGVRSVGVRRPRVRIAVARPEDGFLDAIAVLAEQLVVAWGGEIVPGRSGDLKAALSADIDFIIVAGGSGAGERDASVVALQDAGHLHFHGIGITPGETSAFGSVDKIPVLIVPGRIDAAFAALVTVGHAILFRLLGRDDDAPTVNATLQRKVVSTIGLAEIVPLKLQESHAMPLASGYLPIRAMLQADGYIVVPAYSEGYPAGSAVTIRLMP